MLIVCSHCQSVIKEFNQSNLICFFVFFLFDLISEGKNKNLNCSYVGFTVEPCC